MAICSFQTEREEEGEKEAARKGMSLSSFFFFVLPPSFPSSPPPLPPASSLPSLPPLPPISFPLSLSFQNGHSEEGEGKGPSLPLCVLLPPVARGGKKEALPISLSPTQTVKRKTLLLVFSMATLTPFLSLYVCLEQDLLPPTQLASPVFLCHAFFVLLFLPVC